MVFDNPGRRIVPRGTMLSQRPGIGFRQSENSREISQLSR